VTAPHYHPIKDSRGMASVEHPDHPGPDRRHVHDGQPELLPSVPAEPFERAMAKMAKRAGRTLRPS
jgi:hypothetical protein